MDVFDEQIVIVALGTAGDVVPLLAFGAMLLERYPRARIALVTHAELIESLRSLLRDTTDESDAPAIDSAAVAHADRIELRAIRSSCFRRQVNDSDRVDRAPCGSEDDGVTDYASNDSDSDADVDPMHSARWDASAERRRLEFGDVFEACADARFIIANLFATVAYHVAEYLSIPFLVANPYMIPYAAPSALRERLAAMGGSDSGEPLMNHLDRDLAALTAAAGTDQGDMTEISFADVEHWLWSPLLDASHGDFRDRALRLHPHALRAELEAYGRLPPAPPVLYGLPPQLFPRPACFPRAVNFVGFWTLPPPNEAGETRRHGRIAAFLATAAAKAAATDRVGDSPIPPAQDQTASFPESAWPCVFVSFGSMGAVGLLERPDTLLCLLLAAFRRLRLRAIVVRSSFCPPSSMVDADWSEAQRAALQHLDEAAASGLLLVLTEPVSHTWLFPRVAAVVSHAGSGSIASALWSGVPVLCLPFLFDQFYFAEQTAWLGVGAQLSVRDVARDHSADSSNRIDEALRIVLSESARSKASDIGRLVRSQRAETIDVCARAIARAHAEYVQYRVHILELSQAASLSWRRHWPRLQPTGVRCPWRYVFSLPASPRAADNSSAIAHAGKRQRLTDSKAQTSASSILSVTSQAEIAFLVREIFFDRVYDQKPVAMARLRRGDIVLDIGANVGLFVAFVAANADLARQRVRVVCVEPVPPNFECLCENMRQRDLLAADCDAPDLHFRLHSRLTAQAAAVSVSDAPPPRRFPGGVYPIRAGAAASGKKSAMFCFYPNMAGNSTLASLRDEKQELQRAVINPAVVEQYFEGARTCVAPLVTLDAVCDAVQEAVLDDEQQAEVIASNACSAAPESEPDSRLSPRKHPPLPSHREMRIGLLKIDIEGAELTALFGLAAPQHWRRVRQVVVEVHCVGDRLQRVIERLCAADAGAFRPREVRCVRVSPNAAMVYAAREESDEDEEDGGPTEITQSRSDGARP